MGAPKGDVMKETDRNKLGGLLSEAISRKENRNMPEAHKTMAQFLAEARVRGLISAGTSEKGPVSSAMGGGPLPGSAVTAVNTLSDERFTFLGDDAEERAKLFLVGEYAENKDHEKALLLTLKNGSPADKEELQDKIQDGWQLIHSEVIHPAAA